MESAHAFDVATATRRRPRMSRQEIREALQGYTFILPWAIGFLAFIVGPLLTSLYYSLTRYTLLRPMEWVGLENYTYALFRDSLFWKSIERTLLWTLTTVPLGVLGSFLAALLLDRGVRGTTAWRICFFLPSLTPQVAAVILWVWILQPEVGIVNSLIRMVFNSKGPGWLTSPTWALPSLVGINLWTSIGSNRMLIFLAGLQGVPRELYDASEVDGANWWHRILHVTIPMISPTIFFNLVLGMINSLQVFGVAFVATAGGPAYATYFYALHLYQTAFKSFDMGYGSALAWMLFIVILVMTLVQQWLSKRWVFYSGEVRR
ncbi:MAG TPA: sugar ABC transporter permease [Chloroflexi bacterium]|nr:sugar ABC transporter permease [Chloroflexota bacterium]